MSTPPLTERQTGEVLSTHSTHKYYTDRTNCVLLCYLSFICLLCSCALVLLLILELYMYGSARKTEKRS